MFFLQKINPGLIKSQGRFLFYVMKLYYCTTSAVVFGAAARISSFA